MDNPVEDISDDWALAFMEKGVIVKINMSRWRGSCAISYDDLGLTFCDEQTLSFMKKYITLGVEKVCPPEINSELNVLDAKVKDNLNRYSFQTLWGRFVPFSAFNEWEKNNEVLRKEFFEASKRLENRYADMVLMVKSSYVQLARDVWRRIYPKDALEPSQSFIESFTSKIVDKIPSVENIVASFVFDVVYYNIPLPSFLAEDMRKSQNIYQQKALDAIRFTEEKKSIEKLKNEFINKKKYMIDDFLFSTASSLRKTTADICKNIKEMYVDKESKNLNYAHIEKLKKTIEHVKLMNFQNDTKFENILNELNMELNKFKSERDMDVTLRLLDDIIELSNNNIDCKDFSI